MTIDRCNFLCEHTKSCGCLVIEVNNNRAENLIGQRFGRLVIISRNYSKSKVLWNCLCDCGNTSISWSTSLKSGDTKSCGCYQKERTSEVSTTHGNTKNAKDTTEYKSWCGMKYRCSNSKATKYKNYKEKGITVCDRWLNSFENFLEDMGKAPTPKHTLDRINPNGNYEPSNCRWATQLQQQGNRTNNRWLEYDGKRMILSDWGRFLNVKPEYISYKIRKGFSFGEIYRELLKKL